MKSIFNLLLALFIATVAAAQAPQGLNYQGIARNAQGQPSANAPVSVQFSVLDGSATGTAVYVESQAATTNAFGLFTLGIGQGTASTGTFAGIDWSGGPKFLKVEINGSLSGTSPLLSVPYALFSEKTNLKAGTGISVSGNTITNTSPNTDAQTLSVAGSQLSISGGNSVALPTGTTYTAGTGIAITGSTISNTSPNTDAQTLSVTGQTLAISGGNSVTLPSGGGASQWTTSGSDIYYNTGKVLIGTTTPLLAAYPGIQVSSSSSEAGVLVYGTGGTNHSNFTMREKATGSGWSLDHKAGGGIDHQMTFDYLDGPTNTWNYNTFKITPTGQSGFGMDYNDVPPSRVSVKGGDVNVLDVGKGLILKSPNGSCWRLTVSNAGAAVFTAIACP